jgi:hypothetical protein
LLSFPFHYVSCTFWSDRPALSEAFADINIHKSRSDITSFCVQVLDQIGIS